MKVLVDTCIWSMALRRPASGNSSIVQELRELIDEQRVVMVGQIRQEILSGIKEQAQFEVLRDRLRAFPDLHVDTADYELAADFFNKCRRAGVQGSNTDLFLCALSSRHSLPVFTSDGDFLNFQKHLDFKLHQPRV